MFKVGDKVTSSKFNGIGEVVQIRNSGTYVTQVSTSGSYRSFTRDGRYFSDQPVSLFHVKEEIMGKVTVTIQVTKNFEITEAEQRLIQQLEDKKVVAISFIRKQYDCGLLEAKRICEAVWSTP
mgnify:CR=1 FL=1